MKNNLNPPDHTPVTITLEQLRELIGEKAAAQKPHSRWSFVTRIPPAFLIGLAIAVAVGIETKTYSLPVAVAFISAMFWAKRVQQDHFCQKHNDLCGLVEETVVRVNAAHEMLGGIFGHGVAQPIATIKHQPFGKKAAGDPMDPPSPGKPQNN